MRKVQEGGRSKEGKRAKTKCTCSAQTAVPGVTLESRLPAPTHLPAPTKENLTVLQYRIKSGTLTHVSEGRMFRNCSPFKTSPSDFFKQVTVSGEMPPAAAPHPQSPSTAEHGGALRHPWACTPRRHSAPPWQAHVLRSTEESVLLHALNSKDFNKMLLYEHRVQKFINFNLKQQYYTVQLLLPTYSVS